MKLFHVYLLLFIIAFPTCTFAQAHWRFHIAFEDATGAKDTIWVVLDTAANTMLPIDTQFGEGAVNIDYNQFNVFIFNQVQDTTKTIAVPYFTDIDFRVYAINFQYPINLSWDTSFFKFSGVPPNIDPIGSAFIGNDYFFLVNNFPPIHMFDMIVDNNVYAPAFFWGSQTQFPMLFVMTHGPHPTTGVEIVGLTRSSQRVFPNPCNAQLTINNLQQIENISLISSEQRIIAEFPRSSFELQNELEIQTNEFKSGIYYLRLVHKNRQISHEKIVIIH